MKQVLHLSNPFRQRPRFNVSYSVGTAVTATNKKVFGTQDKLIVLYVLCLPFQLACYNVWFQAVGLMIGIMEDNFFFVFTDLWI